MLELYKKLNLEIKLKELIENGYSREDAIEYLTNENIENASYLIEAYFMPIEEIESEIEKYDNSYPEIDELKFINELSTRYNVDRNFIIERIKTVRGINRAKMLITKERLEDLKIKKDKLELEKRRLNDNSMDTEEKSIFIFGLGIVTIVGGILFYPVSPVIVGIIPIAYSIGVPTLRTSMIMKKQFSVVNELVDLDKEIVYLDEFLNNKSKCNEKENTNKNIEECYSLQTTLLEEKELLNAESKKLIKRKK